MKIQTILLIIVILVYVAYTVKAQIKIVNNIAIGKRQKISNSIMIWLVPFIWYFLIKELIEIDNEIMTKKKRDKLLKKDSGEFYESGEGMYDV